MLCGDSATRWPTTGQPHSIFGIFEGCIGVEENSLSEMLDYYKLQGFQPRNEGTLDAERARELYSVNSSLRSIRLAHSGGADHGLIRLIVWQSPTSDGLGVRGLATRGSRWTASVTTDVFGIANHAELESVNEPSTLYVSPKWIVIYGGQKNKAFQGPLVGVREMLMCRALTRQIFYQACLLSHRTHIFFTHHKYASAS